jgi:hypothetical protein
MTDLLVWGVVAHIVADWFLQNEWMAVNKTKFGHPAGSVHAVIHYAAFLFVFSPFVAFLIAVSHYAIDLRAPLVWWRKTIKQTTDPQNPVTIHIAFWQDQCAHVLCIALAARLIG